MRELSSETQSELQLSDEIDDPLKLLLAQLKGAVHAYNHDDLFLDTCTDATLSEEDYNAALNDFNRLCCKNDRTLTPDDGKAEASPQTIAPGSVYFEEPYDSMLVPAYTPCFDQIGVSSVRLVDIGPIQVQT